MPILTIQRRQTEVGRIRIGESVDTGRTNKYGKPIRKPVKLNKFRFTSASKTLIEQVAAQFGGAPAEWAPQGGGAPQWEVYTEATSIQVVVPPNAVSQWYEAWNGGQCVRRCDGQRELLKDTPCVCPAEPADRNPTSDCKPTTRVSLMLADVPGIGVWRLETHGFYAATELPAAAELLAEAGGYIAGRLELEQRTAIRPKANGSGTETRHWMVPVLHVDAAPKAILAGGSGNGGGAPALTAAQPPAIEAPDASRLTVEKVLDFAPKCQSLAQVQQLWKDAKHDGVFNDEVERVLREVGDRFIARPVPSSPSSSPQPAAGPVVVGESEPDGDEVWSLIMNRAPVEWGTAGLQERILAFLGKPSTAANGFELQRFLDALKNGEVK